MSEGDTVYRPKRCTLWYAREVHCIGQTQSWTHGLCIVHYIDGLKAWGKNWVDEMPIGEPIVYMGQPIGLPKEVYTRAFSIAKKRHALPAHKREYQYEV